MTAILFSRYVTDLSEKCVLTIDTFKLELEVTRVQMNGDDVVRREKEVFLFESLFVAYVTI